MLVETADLDVESTQWQGGWDQNSSRSGGAFDGGSDPEHHNFLANRPIDWNADVVLHDHDPQLYIAQDGTILKMYNVAAHNGAGHYFTVGEVVGAGVTVYVDQIDNNGGSTADFRINANSNASGSSNTNLTGNQGSFRIQSTFDFVRIYNWSDRDLILSGIDVVNLLDLAATVSEYAYNEVAVFRYEIRPPVFSRTQVQIIDFAVATRDNDITLGGEIYNPIGITVVDNANGDILSVPGVRAIVTNDLTLSARHGSIGTARRRPGAGERADGGEHLHQRLRRHHHAPDRDPPRCRRRPRARPAGASAAARTVGPLTWTIGRIIARRADRHRGARQHHVEHHGPLRAVTRSRTTCYDGPGAATATAGPSPPTGRYSTYFYPDGALLVHRPGADGLRVRRRAGLRRDPHRQRVRLHGLSPPAR